MNFIYNLINKILSPYFYWTITQKTKGRILIDDQNTISDNLYWMEETKISNADIINMCGGLKAIYKLPILICDNVKTIMFYDVSFPIMRGIDKLGCPFIVFRYILRTTNEIIIDIIYQSEINNPHKWLFLNSKKSQIAIGYESPNEEGYVNIVERMFLLEFHRQIDVYNSEVEEDNNVLKIELI